MIQIKYQGVNVHSLMNDLVFKHIFSEKRKEFIMYMLSDLLNIEVESKDDLKILDKELPASTVSGKTNQLDLLVKTKNEYINVEVQIKNDKNIKERALSYAMRVLNNGLAKGESYENMKKSIVLLFLNFNLDNRPNVFKSVSLRDNELPHDIFTKQIEIHTIELRKLDIEKGLNDKSIWALLFSMKNESELKRVREYSDVMASIIDEMVEFSREEAESLYRTQVETYELDVISRIETAKVRGIQQGKEEGIMLTAKKLKEASASVEMIMKATGLTIEEIANL